MKDLTFHRVVLFVSYAHRAAIGKLRMMVRNTVTSVESGGLAHSSARHERYLLQALGPVGEFPRLLDVNIAYCKCQVVRCMSDGPNCRIASLWPFEP